MNSFFTSWIVNNNYKITLCCSFNSVAIIKGAFRKSETIVMTDLENLPNHSDKLGMISTVIIGNSSTYNYKDLMINPRGYKSKYNLEEQTNPDLKV